MEPSDDEKDDEEDEASEEEKSATAEGTLNQSDSESKKID